MTSRGKVDLHVHTACSDGTDRPGEVMRKALEAGIRVLAITDHDTLAGAREALRDVPEGMTLVPGIELSCRGTAGKCHILGLGVDPEDRELAGAVAAVSGLRRAKLDARIAFLREQGVEFPQEELETLRAMPAAGKPHLANLMVKYGRAGSREEAISGVLNRCPALADRIDAGIAIRAIRAAGGTAVWAHPMGGVDDSVGEEEFRALLSELLECGIGGLECWYSEYPARRCRYLEDLAKERGLLISGGSDYHGANKSVPLGRLNADALPVRQDELSILEAI